jgi:hypothetical protein
MLSLPRGAFRGNYNVALSSAEWESQQAVERLAFKGGSSLFLGDAALLSVSQRGSSCS